MRAHTALFRLSAATALALLLTASPLHAAAKVELELVGDTQGGGAMGFQQWAQSLSRAGIKNVRIRAAEPNDKAKIDVQGTAESPIYVVTGVITGRDELLVPGARFKQSDAARLAQWLDDLAERGPPNRREAKLAFSLTAKQLEQVNDDLSKAVGFSTVGMTRSEAVEKIGRQLTLPIHVTGSLADEDKVADELSGLSSGTSLACLLRPLGYCMTPRQTAGGLSYAVAKAKLDREVWPIGWPPPADKPLAKLVPPLFEFLNVNVQNVTAAKAIEAIGARLKVPVLMDYNAMARHGVDPAKAIVSMPAGRTTYSLALRKLLFKAGLKFEVRVDEAGKPFLWVSTVKPV